MYIKSNTIMKAIANHKFSSPNGVDVYQICKNCNKKQVKPFPSPNGVDVYQMGVFLEKQGKTVEFPSPNGVDVYQI